MALGQSIRNALGIAWSAAVSAANAGQNAVAAIGRALSSAGEQLTAPVLLDTTTRDQIAGLGQSWADARAAFGAANPDDPITSSMITLAPWSADLNTFNTSPNYHLVVGINVEGQEKPVYRTITGISQLPDLVGELRQSTYVNALAMSVGTTPGGGVGGTVTGIDSITITVGPSPA